MGYKVKSNFIKNLIKGKSFRNENFRIYIDRLIYLERSITGDGWKGGWAGSIALHACKSEYAKEYKELLKELDPKEHKKFIDEERKERLEDEEDSRRWAKEERAAEIAEKKWWESMGGIK